VNIRPGFPYSRTSSEERMARRKAPWRKANPKKKKGGSHKLSPAQKAWAKRSAKKAGHRYPDLIDNMCGEKVEQAHEI
jgi:hypothetical protein